MAGSVLEQSHLTEALGCFAVVLAIPGSSGTPPASLCHTQLPQFIWFCYRNKLIARVSCGWRALWTRIIASFCQAHEEGCNDSNGSWCNGVKSWYLSSRWQTLCSLPCFPSAQTLLGLPKMGDAVGTLPARGHERDGSEARSFLLTRGVSEAAKTHSSNVSAWLSQRERSGLCLHGKIALLSLRV